MVQIQYTDMYYQTPQYDVYNYNMCAYNTKIQVSRLSECMIA